MAPHGCWERDGRRILARAHRPNGVIRRRGSAGLAGATGGLWGAVAAAIAAILLAPLVGVVLVSSSLTGSPCTGGFPCVRMTRES